MELHQREGRPSSFRLKVQPHELLTGPAGDSIRFELTRKPKKLRESGAVRFLLRAVFEAGLSVRIVVVVLVLHFLFQRIALFSRRSTAGANAALSSGKPQR